jgi:hypothetical protein
VADLAVQLRHGPVATRYTHTHANGGTTVLTALSTTATYTRDLRDALTQRFLTVGLATFTHWYDYDGRGLLWKVLQQDGSDPRRREE